MSDLSEMKQKALRLMIERKRSMDDAWQNLTVARREYVEAQDLLCGMYAETDPPGPFICGSLYIKYLPSKRLSDDRFEYVEAQRCPTSE